MSSLGSVLFKCYCLILNELYLFKPNSFFVFLLFSVLYSTSFLRICSIFFQYFFYFFNKIITVLFWSLFFIPNCLITLCFYLVDEFGPILGSGLSSSKQIKNKQIPNFWQKKGQKIACYFIKK